MRAGRWMLTLLALLLLLPLAVPVDAGSKQWADGDGAVDPAGEPDLGPDVVIFNELESLYDPVPFAHKAHAQMAQMWNGCETCHHRAPEPTTQPIAVNHDGPVTQDAAAEVPACKSCHPVSEHDQAVNIHMPSLKGAYHRQCLNCHREWSGESGCVACHLPHTQVERLAAAPTPDDVAGRMHPPIEAPGETTYVTRFTPAVGQNVLFRHDEHANAFGLKCVSCHHRDTCRSCHNGAEDTARQALLAPARSWRDSHGPCMSCHQDNNCNHCHYTDEQVPPPPFDHALTGLALDDDHAELACGDCHAGLRLSGEPTCGDAACHAERPAIAWPGDAPGTLIEQPAAVIASPIEPPPATQPSKAVIRRVRR